MPMKPPHPTMSAGLQCRLGFEQQHHEARHSLSTDTSRRSSSSSLEQPTKQASVRFDKRQASARKAPHQQQQQAQQTDSWLCRPSLAALIKSTNHQMQSMTDRLNKYQANSLLKPNTKNDGRRRRDSSSRGRPGGSRSLLLALVVLCLAWCELNPLARVNAASSTMNGHKLARELLSSHYQTQIMNHIEQQVAAAHQNKNQNHDHANSNGLRHHQQDLTATTRNLWEQHVSVYDEQPHQSQAGVWSTSGELASAPTNLMQQMDDERLVQPRPPANQLQQQFVAYQARQQQPTTPTLNKQLAPPPPYYELGLTPTNALQLELPSREQRYQPSHGTQPMMVHPNPGRIFHQDHPQMLRPADSVASPQLASPEDYANLMLSASANATGTQRQTRQRQAQGEVGALRDSRSMMLSNQLDSASSSSDGVSAKNVQGKDSQSAADQTESSAMSDSSSSGQTSDSKYDNNNQNQVQLDKGVEPRQRRRLFNRILKKAEWNHLFVELSKVFLRHLLDIALKDIIGKQSGSTGDSATTGRKKLDAQSEFADMLKDFIKTAITNI